MNALKILFATDFSAASRTALAVASSLARTCHAQLYLVHVLDMPVVEGGEEVIGSLYEASAQAAQTELANLELIDGPWPVRRALLHGAPVDEILGFAQEEHIDLIVIGTHGRTGLTRLLMGSVAEELVRRATCPVLTVKPDAHVPPVYSPDLECLERCEPIWRRGLSARVGGAPLS